MWPSSAKAFSDFIYQGKDNSSATIKKIYKELKGVKDSKGSIVSLLNKYKFVKVPH